MELPSKSKERKRGSAEKGERGKEGGRVGGRNRREGEQGREGGRKGGGRKEEGVIDVPFPWVPSHMIHFSHPTQALLLMKDAIAEPSQLTLVSGWNRVSEFCILLVYIFWSSSKWKKEKEKKIPRQSFGQFHLPLPLVWRIICMSRNGLEEGWR